MAQGTTINSTGTNLSSEGSGTQAGIMNAVHSLHRLVLKWPPKKGDPNDKNKDENKKDENEKNEHSSTNSKTKKKEELNSNKANEHSSTDQESADREKPEYVERAEPQLPTFINQTHEYQAPPPDTQSFTQQPTVVDSRIGSFHSKDTISNIDTPLSRMNPTQQEALGVAMTGGLPDEDVSITAKRDDGEVIHFSANSQVNSGWSVQSEAQQQNFTASEMNTEFEAQSGAAVNSIHSMMTQTFDGDGPHKISGARFTISMDNDQVLVTESQTGRIVDAVDLDQVSNTVIRTSQEINGRDPTQQAKEAIADYRSLGGATMAPTPPNKQPELTL